MDKDGNCGMKYEIVDGNLYINEQKIDFNELVFLRELGRGANGITFSVNNIFPERKEVIKIWFEENQKGKLIVDKFINEVQKNATVYSINTPQIYEAKNRDNIHWCRMQYIDGETLRTELQKKPVFIIRYIWAEKMLKILSEVYQKNVYHGDLHSNNIIIEKESGEPYLLDFGTSLLSGIEKSHRRDARMLYYLIKEILPEMQMVRFISDDLYNQKSEIVCEILAITIRITYGIMQYKKGSLDDYGIKSELIMPINIIKDICKEKKDSFEINERLIEEYFSSLKLKKEKYEFLMLE